MIQLSFQPAFDTFHTIFRLLRLRSLVAKYGPLPRDHVRILDFYLLFPFKIDSIRLSRSDRKYRRLANEYKDAKPYGEQPDNLTLFSKMAIIENTGLEALARSNLIKQDRWETGEVSTTDQAPSDELIQRISEINSQENSLIEFLSVLASEYKLLGPDGLKDRTGLLEYRYDSL